MKSQKRYKVINTKYSYNGTRTYEQEGTLQELIEAYSYTLECGQSYQHEKGNKKINPTSKTIKSLITNLYNAKNNSAANGYSGCSFTYEEIN